MARKFKNILSLDSKGAMDFFMKSEQYQGFEMPEYFVFDNLLDKIRDVIADTPYEECLLDGVLPENLSDVNIDILFNKDGKYAVRPLMLANPLLYYFLVREICNKESWNTIKELFGKFNVTHITACALPVIRNDKEKFHNSTAVLNWWNALEQRSIELSLEYRYMFVTDITNCYGSINPQAFDWAFSLKRTKLEMKDESNIAGNIQKYLRALQQGRNIGIPQGSAIFDFMSEIILGYSDLLLHEAIEKEGITEDYKIIRYRDDYRIFCNDKDALEKISYELQHVLESLNFRMNSKKTKLSESIVTDSVKPDKLAYIYNTPIFNKKDCDFDSFEKYLLYILMFSRKYPDCGSIKTMLSDLDKRIKRWIDDKLKKKDDMKKWETVDLGLDSGEPKNADASSNPTTNDKKSKQSGKNIFDSLKVYGGHYERDWLPGGNIRAMAAVCTQIALENVGCCHYALLVLSRMVNFMTNEKEKWDIIDKVYKKLCKLPNSDYNQLWLQNITYQKNKKEGKSPYELRLCEIVAGNKEVELWNNKWIKPELLSAIPINDIVDGEILKKVTPVITFREMRRYNEI